MIQKAETGATSTSYSIGVDSMTVDTLIGNDPLNYT